MGNRVKTLIAIKPKTLSSGVALRTLVADDFRNPRKPGEVCDWFVSQGDNHLCVLGTRKLMPDRHRSI